MNMLFGSTATVIEFWTDSSKWTPAVRRFYVLTLPVSAPLRWGFYYTFVFVAWVTYVLAIAYVNVAEFVTPVAERLKRRV